MGQVIFRQISDISCALLCTVLQNEQRATSLSLIKTITYNGMPSYEPGGRRFEFFRARHINQGSIPVT